MFRNRNEMIHIKIWSDKRRKAYFLTLKTNFKQKRENIDEKRKILKEKNGLTENRLIKSNYTKKVIFKK